MEALISDKDFITATLKNFEAIFTPKQLFYLSVLAQNRKEAGFGSVSFRFWRGTLSEITEEITTKPVDIPNIVASLLKSNEE